MSTAFLTGVSGGGGMKTVDIYTGEYVFLGTQRELAITNGQYGLDMSVFESKTLDKLLYGTFRLIIGFNEDNSTSTRYAHCVVQGVSCKVSDTEYEISGVVNAATGSNYYHIEGTLRIKLKYVSSESTLYLTVDTNDALGVYYSGTSYALSNATASFGGAKLIFN